MKTSITKLLGIEYPIIQGGMAWVAEYHLAVAVSEAGGLGLIGAANSGYLPCMWPWNTDTEGKRAYEEAFWCEYYVDESSCR